MRRGEVGCNIFLIHEGESAFGRYERNKFKIKEIERDRERGHTVVDEECQDDSACSSNAAFEGEGSAADGGATGEAHT